MLHKIIIYNQKGNVISKMLCLDVGSKLMIGVVRFLAPIVKLSAIQL